MGKGDKKTKRGKITIGSYGKTRPRKKKKSSTVAKKIVKTSKPKVTKTEELEVKAPIKTAAKKTTAKKTTTKKTTSKKTTKKSEE